MTSSDTDTSKSSDSSISSCKKKRKTSKKQKYRRETKKKKHAKKEHRKLSKSRKVDSHSEEEQVRKIEFTAPVTAVDLAAATDTVFGPALPPQLLQKTSTASVHPIIGPSLPKDFELASAANVENADIGRSSDETDDCGIFGPLPIGHMKDMSATQIELEQRALQLKLAAIDDTNNTGQVEQKEREEWMLELPAVGLKSGLAAIANMKRTFHQGKDKPDFTDRSSWTKTPNNEGKPPKPSTSKSAAEALKSTAQAMYERERDAEQESIAKNHKKKHKRDKSLVDMHQKKLRREQRKRAKELAASGFKPERRPFTRDIDLKLNKIDSNQTKQIVDKAKILNTKFATGHTKYL